jgi:hypothetical protein
MARRTNSDILTRFEDGLESGLKRHKKTIAAIEAAMGKPPPEAKAAVMVVQRGQRRPLRARRESHSRTARCCAPMTRRPAICPAVIDT